MSLAAYRRVRSLGSGAYGEAVLVERRSDGLKLVVKELHASHLSAEELEKEGKDAPDYEKVKADFEEREAKKVTDSIDSMPIKQKRKWRIW